MIAAELRGGNKPSLNEALGWIGSRVDDIYGANVGRLEDVWIDPGTGAPRWLLVKEGRFGGRTTLIPFEDATAGAGHVWVPYEREIVREAPEIEPGAPLTQQVEAVLRSHYAANVPPAIAHAGSGAGASAPPLPAPAPKQEPPAPTATLRFATGGAQSAPPPSFGASQPAPATEEPQRVGYRPPAPTPRRPVQREQPTSPPGAQPQGMPPGLPPRPAPPIATPPPQGQPNQYAYPQQQSPPPSQGPPPGYAYPPPSYQQPGPYPPAPSLAPPQAWHQPPPPSQQSWQPPPYPPYPPQQAWQPPPPVSGPDPIETLNSLAGSAQVHYVEIELSGELSIRGELRSVRVIPRDQGPGYGG